MKPFVIEKLKKINNTINYTESKNIRELINENKNLFTDNKFLYGENKNLICSLWAGMICFGFQLNNTRFNNISIKINNLLNKLNNDIKQLEIDKKKINLTIPIIKRELISNGYNVDKFNLLFNSNITMEKINLFKEKNKNCFDKDKFIELINPTELINYYNNYVEKINETDMKEYIKLQLGEVNYNRINRPLVREPSFNFYSDSDSDNDSDNDVPIPIPIPNTDSEPNIKSIEQLYKEYEIIEECYKKGIKEINKKKDIDMLNEFIDLCNENYSINEQLTLYYNEQLKFNYNSSIITKITNNYKNMNLGFDEILLYKYFKKISLFNVDEKSYK